MPQLELSLIEGASRLTSSEEVPAPRHASAADSAAEVHPEALARWAATVSGAVEPCLVLTVDSTIVACSKSCAEMIGLGDEAAAAGRKLREAVADLVDFTESLDRLDQAETDKIPPLLAISSGRLARGLLRVACRESKTTCTMDAIATPLWDGQTVAGSLTFFSRI